MFQTYSTNHYGDENSYNGFYVECPVFGGNVAFNMAEPFEKMMVEVFNEPEIVRMLNKPQLAFIQHKLIGTHHTRLVHVIGTLGLMRTAIYRSKINSGMTWSRAAKFTKKEQATIAASGLHDIGQTFPGHPFDFAMEELFPDTFQGHEKAGLEIIRNSRIKDILNSYSTGFADMVLAVMAEDDLKNNVWQQLLAGNLNMDTFNYLALDQKHMPTRDEASFLVRSVVENIKIKGNKLILPAGQANAFQMLLEMRGKMYSEVYWNGFPQAAGIGFFHILMKQISDKLNHPKYACTLKSINNPYINFIASKGRLLGDYTELTDGNFTMLISQLAKSQIPELSKTAAAYENIAANFKAINIYSGDAKYAPSDKDLLQVKEIVEQSGGVYKNLQCQIYKTKKPEVYIDDRNRKLQKFSEYCPGIADKSARNISALFMYKRNLDQIMDRLERIIPLPTQER